MIPDSYVLKCNYYISLSFTNNYINNNIILLLLKSQKLQLIENIVIPTYSSDNKTQETEFNRRDFKHVKLFKRFTISLQIPAQLILKSMNIIRGN